MRTRQQVAISFALVIAAAACEGKIVGPGGGGDDDGGNNGGIDAILETDAPGPPPIPADCLEAADRGLAWLVQQQQADGSWGNGSKIASTGFVVLKIETYAWEIGQSAFSPNFIYRQQLQAGLDYLFRAAQPVAIRPQPHGNPDSNGNGQGIQFSGSIYEESIALMAVAGGSEPLQVVNVPGSAVNGLSYGAVAQDTLDYMVMAQSDATTSNPGSCNRGGWRYGAFDNSVEVGDNSVSQWATLALEYARHPLYRYQIQTPDWALTELRDWVTCIQNRDGGAMDGAGGYTSSSQILNAYKTGAVIQQASFLGDNSASPNVVAAAGFLSRMWNDTSIGWKRNGTSDYLAMYSIMKGMESVAITDLNGIDWYREFCDQLKAEQQPNGSWPLTAYDAGSGGINSTAWALLILERAAPPPEIIN